MATGWSHTTTKNTNFARLCRLLIDGGTRVLRDVFDSFYPPGSLQGDLLSAPVHATLKGLKAKRVLNVSQWKKLYPVAGTSVSSVSFDITLLFLLLRNICGLKPPATGWDNLPPPSDKSKVADLIRIKFYRNEFYGHINKTAIPDSRFRKYWSDISDVLVRLGGAQYRIQIDRLEKTSMDAEDEEYYNNCLKEWEEYEQSLKERFNEVDAGLQEISKKVDETKVIITENIEKGNEKVDGRIQELSNQMVATQGNITEKIEEGNEKVGGRLQELSNQMDVTQGSITKISEQQQHLVKVVKKIDERQEGKRNLEMEASKLIEDYSKRLRLSITKQTDFQPKLMPTHLWKDQVIRTDDIFTNLTLRHGRQSLPHHQDGEAEVGVEDNEEMTEYSESESDEETHDGTDDETDDDDTLLRSSAEMFVYSKKPKNSEKENKTRGNPKSVLVAGKPGIGKTLLCQKLIRDWASGHLFQTLEEQQEKPEFNFAYLLTFRQLSPLKQQEFDLRDIFNLSCVLDEGSIIDEKTFGLILQNKENLLLIIDGYDEYSHDKKDDDHEMYPNDPHTKMPLHAMIAKLLQRKILEGCTLLITSRPHESEDLEKGKVNFEQHVEIKGFSKRQVIEYVEKYFKTDEKNSVVCEHLRKNKSLTELAHVPMLCFLVCYCMEWYITNSKTFENLPITTADLYSEVIKIFEVKHHSMSQYRKDPIPQHFTVPPVVEDTLRKLSELAALFMKEDKYVFDEDNLKSFGLNKQDIETLQGSGIILCGPGFRKSPFAEVTLEYSFTHLTVQEYMVASYFVEQGKLPKKEEVTDMVFHFMVQLWSRKKDENTEKMMEELLLSFKPKQDSRMYLYNMEMSLEFLKEYQDIKFMKRIALDHFRGLYQSKKMILISRVPNSFCSTISFLLNIYSLVNQDLQEKTVTFPTELHVDSSPLKSVGVEEISNSLSNKYSPFTCLSLCNCKLNDSRIKKISEALPLTNLTELRLWDNKIKDVGMAYICRSLIEKECKISTLYLGNNDATDFGALYFCEAIKHEDCKLSTLDLQCNKITDRGVHSLCLALMDNNCKLKKLVLYGNATRYGPNYAFHMTYDVVKQAKPDVELELWESITELLMARIMSSYCMSLAMNK